MVRRSTGALVATTVATLVLAACTSGPDADTARRQAAAQEQQLTLMSELSAQKDSLTNIVLETDRFLAIVDSQLTTVKGVRGRKVVAANEDPMSEQLQMRADLLARVDLLVKRAKETSAALAESRKREASLRKKNDALEAQLASSERTIVELGETVERQLAYIGQLQGRVDSLTTDNARLAADTTRLGGEVRTLSDAQARAWYVVGTEDELLKKGIVVREGGANLLVARVGRTIVPSRELTRTAFTPIDIRRQAEIPLPDPARKYEIVSRHSLQWAETGARDKKQFREKLQITDAGEFWANSRYLILVMR